MYVDRYNDTHVRVAPCCYATFAIEPVEQFDFYHSPYLTSIRNKFDRGEQPAECHRCWSAEKVGLKSKRQSSIEFYNDPSPDTTVQLQSLDHSATWACNLACIMCGPKDSSYWALQQNLNKDDLTALGRMFQKNNNFLDRLDLGHMKKIHFNGGEPMLNNDQTDLLEKLDQQGVLNQVLISYNTNGTVMPSKKIIDLWSRARLVKLFFSIDAVESAFEYIRWPGSWSQTQDNLLNMRDNLPGNVMFGFNVTIGSYNVMEVKALHAWFEQHMKHNNQGDLSDFCWGLARTFDPASLGQHIKTVAIQELQDNNDLRTIANYLESTLNYNEDQSWMHRLDDLDNKRNTNWKTALRVAKFIKETNC